MKILTLLSIIGLNVVKGYGVMGIDYGTDWLKISVVKNGIPLEVVLNKESKRKTDSVITFRIRNGIRYFGSEGASLGIRFPRNSYPKLKNLLGRKFDDPIAKEYRNSYDNLMDKNLTRNTIIFNQDKETYSVEELVANQLIYAKELCFEFAGEAIKEAVITVPPYWTQYERQALLDAAELAGLRVLQLLNDETAVAVNYGMTRQFDAPQFHIFFDVGAGSTVATLVEFKNVEEKISKYKSKNVTGVIVKAVGYDRTLGGHEMDVRLQNFLADQFMKEKGTKKGINVRDNLRSMARLLKEANRVKHILSANTETQASVESLIEEIDFRSKVTREDFETICKDLFDRLRGPVDKVLHSANLKLDDVQSFILVGGTSRVPAVQAKLEEILGKDKIAKHVNADEAAVLGAGLLGAAMVPSFRVKQYKIKDITPFPIQVVYDSEPKEGSEVRRIRQNVFGAGSFTDIKKKLTFKRQSDFEITVQYNSEILQDEPTFGPVEIFKAQISGVPEAMANIKNSNLSESKIIVKLELSASGLIVAPEAYLEVETKQEEVKKPSLTESISDTFNSFFGGGDKKENSDPVENADTKKPADEFTTAESNKTEGDNKNSTEKAKKDTGPPKPTIEQFNLTVTLVYNDIIPIDDQKDSILERIAKMDHDDKERKKMDIARNQLESFIYNTQDALTSSTIEKVSNAEEREKLSSELSAASDWLYAEEHNNYTVLNSKYEQLKTLYDPIEFRNSELTKRPEETSNLKNVFETISKFLKDIEQEEITEKAEAKKYLAEKEEAEKLKKAEREEKKKAKEEKEKKKEAESESEEKEKPTTDESKKKGDSNEEDLKDEDIKEEDVAEKTEKEPAKEKETEKEKEKVIPEDPPLYPLAEVAKLKVSLEMARKWLEDNLVLQDKLSLKEDPVLKSADLRSKIFELEFEVKMLKNRKRVVYRPKIKKPKKKDDKKQKKTKESGKDEKNQSKESSKDEKNQSKESSKGEKNQSKESSKDEKKKDGKQQKTTDDSKSTDDVDKESQQDKDEL